MGVGNPLFQKRPKNFAIGGDIQRQKRVLMLRLKVPPAINQFSNTIDRNEATQLLKLLSKYQPESRESKRERLLEMAKQKEAGQEVIVSQGLNKLRRGINHVTSLVESKQAKLVVIAHDVDPIETVMWLPALCRKMDVPYCIIKGKSRLGALVHQKTATCVAVTSVSKADTAELEALCRTFRSQYNENADIRRKWGGGIVGMKSQHVIRAREKALELERAKKAGLAL